MVDKKHWVFAAKIHDRAGAVTAVASVFSNRGVSVEMTLGSTISVPVPDSIGLYYVFESTEARKTTLLRAVSRLSVVISVECYSIDSPKLRAVGVARIAPGFGPDEGGAGVVPSDKLACRHPIEGQAGGRAWLLMAAPKEMMDYLDRLRDAKALEDATVTILPVG